MLDAVKSAVADQCLQEPVFGLRAVDGPGQRNPMFTVRIRSLTCTPGWRATSAVVQKPCLCVQGWTAYLGDATNATERAMAGCMAASPSAGNPAQGLSLLQAADVKASSGKRGACGWLQPSFSAAAMP